MSNAKANKLDRNVEAPAPLQAEALEALERVYEGTGDADSDWQDYDAVRRFIEQAGTGAAPEWRDELAARAMEGMLVDTLASVLKVLSRGDLRSAPKQKADHD